MDVSEAAHHLWTMTYPSHIYVSHMSSSGITGGLTRVIPLAKELKDAGWSQVNLRYQFRGNTRSWFHFNGTPMYELPAQFPAATHMDTPA